MRIEIMLRISDFICDDAGSFMQKNGTAEGKAGCCYYGPT